MVLFVFQVGFKIRFYLISVNLSSKEKYLMIKAKPHYWRTKLCLFFAIILLVILIRIISMKTKILLELKLLLLKNLRISTLTRAKLQRWLNSHIFFSHFSKTANRKILFCQACQILACLLIFVFLYFWFWFWFFNQKAIQV